MKQYRRFGILVLLFISSCSSGQITISPDPVPSSESETSSTTSADRPIASPVSFMNSGQHLGSGRSWDTALGDLDGDEDLDAVVVNDGRGEAISEVWLNDGHANLTVMEQDLGYGMGLELGDLDGDNDLDVFIVGFEESGRVWLNDGMATFIHSGQSLGSEGGWDVVLGDLDGDGDLDAFIAHGREDTVWLNDGSGGFTDTGQQLGTSFTAAAGLGDVDGDGDLDVVTVGWNDPGKVWLNDGAGNLEDSGQTLTPGSIHIHGMALGDLNGDGALDVFMAGSPNQVWINDGAGVFQHSGQELIGGAGDSVALGDVDGDGDIDAFLAVGDWSNSDDKLWLNDGNGWFVDSGLTLSDVFSSGIALGDLDGDGDLDAFIVHGELGQDSGGGIHNEVWINETY